MQAHTKDRVVDAAMRLFGEQGYAATSVAQIEAAAGLAPGSGGLYKHFGSKAELLAEGITRLLADGASLRELIQASRPSEGDDLPPQRQRVAALAEAGLRRLEDERDFNRILVRDLRRFPDLLAKAKDDELAGNHRALAAWLTDEAGGVDRDWDAIAAVLMGATAHFWLLRDVFGGDHPTGVSAQRYLNALVELVMTALEPRGPAAARPTSRSRAADRTRTDGSGR